MIRLDLRCVDSSFVSSAGLILITFVWGNWGDARNYFFLLTFCNSLMLRLFGWWFGVLEWDFVVCWILLTLICLCLSVCVSVNDWWCSLGMCMCWSGKDSSEWLELFRMLWRLFGYWNANAGFLGTCKNLRHFVWLNFILF